MLNKTSSKDKSVVYSKILYGIITVLIIGLIINDLLISKSSFNFRIILELFFLPYIILRINLDVNLSKNNYNLIKTVLNFIWSIVTIVVGVLGFLEIFLSISLFEIEGNVATILSFVIGIYLIINIIKYFYSESNFPKYKLSIKYLSYVLIGLNIIIIALVIFSNLINIGNINFGNNTSGVFILDIIVTLLILVMLTYFLYILFIEKIKYENFNNFLKTSIPSWFVLLLLIILFFQLFVINLLNSNINLGRDLFQDTVKNSIFTGSIYLLLGIGLTMVYKLLNFANFSHGELIIFGSYVSITALEGVNIGFFPNLALFIAVAFISSAVISIISDFFVFRPLRNKNAEPFTFMIASIGLSIILRFGLTSVYGVSSYGVVIPGAPLLNVVKYVVILMAIVSVVLLELLLKKTKIGKAMRAMADNPKLAQVSGISPTMIFILVWFIGSGLAGMGGLFRLISNAALIPSFGFSLLLPTFAVVILGGIGSYRGAIFAGYIVGFAENFGAFILIFFRQIKETFVLEIPIILGDFSVRNFFIKPSFSQEYQIAIGFIILVLVLLVKPTGIMGEEVVRER